jgi:hypothetical protein|tara:strand:- start:1653 stop:1787 length:135 start_codon:yes stop_codon:yes gene_type:complete
MRLSLILQAGFIGLKDYFYTSLENPYAEYNAKSAPTPVLSYSTT